MESPSTLRAVAFPRAVALLWFTCDFPYLFILNRVDSWFEDPKVWQPHVLGTSGFVNVIFQYQKSSYYVSSRILNDFYYRMRLKQRHRLEGENFLDVCRYSNIPLTHSHWKQAHSACKHHGGDLLKGSLANSQETTFDEVIITSSSPPTFLAQRIVSKLYLMDKWKAN